MDNELMVDTHVHFWDLRKPDTTSRYDWAASDAEDDILGNLDPIRSARFDIDAMWGEARFANVGAFVHIQATTGPDPAEETRWLTQMRHQSRSQVPFTIVGHVDLTTSEAPKQLDAHCESPYFVGVRDFALHGAMQAASFPDALIESARLLAERDLVLDLFCAWEDLPRALRFAEDNPGLKIVLEHLGCPLNRDNETFAGWAANMSLLARAENVSVKVSGAATADHRFTVESLRPWVEHCVDTFGADRVLIGSNWPIDRMFSSYDVIMGLYRHFVSGLSLAERRTMFLDNPARVYRVSPGNTVVQDVANIRFETSH
ncbi:hypothetical protein ASC77_23670 [Nocardioides sp. Root1257]|uniref:amidohydrolase family protein n=1 Tax=unclassified Nocardioides TaxID=2615069 RepID=UPI0006F5E81E|nr:MULTISPECIES: amidohydrolase family protein [unclassified Nocardioides]KQW42660.1 hypothetical protein ASC77_23670 [Nocardioides sp. Root1257]KRC39918.1 hypothetical protein ASE24_23465 [Nocardioides sp. Root224]